MAQPTKSAALVMVFGLAAVATAQAQEPAAQAFTNSYSIDQSRYFPSSEIERAELSNRIAESMSFPAEAPTEPMALGSYLNRAELLLAQLQRHSAYLYLRASRELDDRADADASDQADDAMQSLITTVQGALGSIGKSEFTKASFANPALAQYEYILKRAEKELPHKLPTDQQAVLSAIADPAAANLWALYQQTMRSTQFPAVNLPTGQFDVKKYARSLNANPDRAIRRAAWEGRMNGYASRSEIYASILLGVVRLNDRLAQLRHFPDAPSNAYFSKELNRTKVTEALAAIESHADLQKDYQRMQSRLGIDPGFSAPGSIERPTWLPNCYVAQQQQPVPAAVCGLANNVI